MKTQGNGGGDITPQPGEAEFQRLVQGVTDYAIYMLYPDGRIASWNAGAERIKGYKADEIIGQSFAVFYTEEDRANNEPQRTLDTARRSGRVERESIRVRKDGTRFWAHVVVDPIHDDDGNLTGFAKITRDITRRVEAERELEIAREQLFQAQKMEAIGQLTGGMAHDFNNLLTAVRGSLELLRRRVENDPRSVQLVDNAMAGAERGAALTQRLLSYARRQTFDIHPVDLEPLLAGMTDMLRGSVGPMITVTQEVVAAAPPALCDPTQLETALLNLAVNARDAMPDGGTIAISASTETVLAGEDDDLDAGPYLRIDVTDTGSGMDADTLKRATEPFFTTKGIGKGTGLGLSMVHGFARQSGGMLRLSSHEGQGTVATLLLPVADSAEIQPVPVPPKPEANGGNRPLSILAVDDDPLVLMNTTAMLEDLGHQVKDAISGAEALDLLASGASFDLVVTDHAMPGMSGAELAKRIRADRPDLPILLATGYAELPSGDTSLPRLAKPYSQQELATALEKVLHATTA